MRKCIIIPEYSDVGASYDYAAENYETIFPDGDIDTAQGRRDFISLALYYLKDNNVVPSQQSIQIIVDTLLDVDTALYNGMVSLAANEAELKNVVQQNWDTVSITPDSKNIAPEANDFPMSPIPSIRSGLDTIFDNINDQERFVRIFQNDLTRFSFVNYNSNTLITTPEDLNTSIRMYKNQIFEDLADDLNQPKSSMYIGREFQKTAYDELVKTARVYFHPYTSSGIFISNDIKIINAYNKFLILTNFDGFITKYSKDLIQVARGFIGGHIDPKNGYKYTYNIGKHIKQDYNDVTNDISDHVNNAVQLFINSIPLLDADNKPTGQYVNFKSFQSLTRIFRNIAEKKRGVTREIRDNPRKAIPMIIDIANEFKSTYLRGDDTVLIPTFNSIRHYVFDTNNPSSLASLESKISDFSGMNLYSMILNHINKTSPVSYLQYKYSAETGKYVISYLDSESISQKQTDLEKHLMIQSQYDNYSEIFAKHNITIQQSDNGIAQSISFNIGGADYKYTLMGRKITPCGDKSTNES